MFGLSKYFFRRRLVKFIVGTLIAGFVFLGIRQSVLHSIQQAFLTDVQNLRGFYELRPVGPKLLRDALGENRMRGWDTIIGVSVADAEINDAWIELHRSRLQSLEWIDLTGTAITEAGLEKVLRLPRLKELYLLDSTVPDEALAALFASHPQITVQPMRKARKASLMAKRPIHTKALTFAQFSPNGRRIVTGNGEGRAQVWDAAVQNLVFNCLAHDGWVFQAAWSSDGTTLATVGTDDRLRLWDVSDGSCLGEWIDDEGDLHGVQFSPDGKRIFIAGDGGTVRALSVDGFKEILAMPGHTKPIPGLALSPSGRTLASVSRDRTLRLWDTETGEALAVQADHEADVYAVAFSPDGHRLATASYDRTVMLRDSETGQSERRLTGHTDWVFAVAFSEDGETLASGGGDGTIRLWNVTTGECEQTLRRQRTISGLSFHAELLASSGIDGTVCLWNWKSGTLEEILRPAARVAVAESASDPDQSSEKAAILVNRE